MRPSTDDRDAAMIWIIDNQRFRRNVSEIDRIALAMKREEIVARKAKANLRTPTGGLTSAKLPKSQPPVNTRQESAKAAGVGERTYDAAERMLGAILKQTPKNPGTKGQLKGDVVGGTKLEPPTNRTPTLAESRISKRLSSEAQALDDVPTADFEAAIKKGNVAGFRASREKRRLWDARCCVCLTGEGFWIGVRSSVVLEAVLEDGGGQWKAGLWDSRAIRSPNTSPSPDSLIADLDSALGAIDGVAVVKDQVDDPRQNPKQ